MVAIDTVYGNHCLLDRQLSVEMTNGQNDRFRKPRSYSYSDSVPDYDNVSESDSYCWNGETGVDR